MDNCKFLLNDKGSIWTRSYRKNGKRTAEQLAFGFPKEATHIIGSESDRFFVQYYDADAPEETVYTEYLRTKRDLKEQRYAQMLQEYI